MIFRRYTFKEGRFLLVLGIAAIMGLAMGCGSGSGSSSSKVFDNYVENKKVEVAPGPSALVKEFWELSLRGEKERAFAYLGAGSVSDLYWVPAKTEKPVPEEITAHQSGTGSSNPQAHATRFAELLKGWPETINRGQFSISSIISEVVQDDRAEVAVALTRSGYESAYNVRVLLKKDSEDWKIIAIWDLPRPQGVGPGQDDLPPGN